MLQIRCYMAARSKPLSDAQARQAKPRAKEYNLADGDGLFLRVKPNGTRTWIFNYFKPYTRKRSNLTIGKYPGVPLTLARKKRNEYLELLAQDIDPKAFKEDQQREQDQAHRQTLQAVAGAWMVIKRTKITESYANDIERSLELHVMPKLGKLPIHMIRAQDAIAALEPIANRGSLETVKRLCQRLNEIMTYSVNTGLVEHNTLAGIGKAFIAPAKQHMPTLAPDQLPNLMLKLSRASIRISTRCLIEWQLHTMVRPSEAAGTRWEEFDLDKGLWHIPGHRMKKKAPHTVPLTPQALALLDTMRPISGHTEFVFPSERNPRTHMNQQTANTALKRMGFRGQLVAHGLRALASTTLNEQGFDPDVIEAALAHNDKNSVRAAYNRADYLKRRKALMCWWSNHIVEASQGYLSIAGHKHLRPVEAKSA